VGRNQLATVRSLLIQALLPGVLRKFRRASNRATTVAGRHENRPEAYRRIVAKNSSFSALYGLLRLFPCGTIPVHSKIACAICCDELDVFPLVRLVMVSWANGDTKRRSSVAAGLMVGLCLKSRAGFRPALRLRSARRLIGGGRSCVLTALNRCDLSRRHSPPLINRAVNRPPAHPPLVMRVT